MAVTIAETLQSSFVAVEANDLFTEAVLRLGDNSRLCFCHRVDERWAKAVCPDLRESEQGLAVEFLGKITMFRLNAKHLDIQFQDGSRWDRSFKTVENSQDNTVHPS